MRVVLDASVAVQACIEANGFDRFAGHELVVPPIFASETLAALREMLYRKEISDALASIAIVRRAELEYEIHMPEGFWTTAWQLASRLGWAKTYDAEYVALAQLLEIPLVTLDGRLARGSASVVKVMGPADLPASDDVAEREDEPPAEPPSQT